MRAGLVHAPGRRPALWPADRAGSMTHPRKGTAGRVLSFKSS
jgi:hypothetical protein